MSPIRFRYRSTISLFILLFVTLSGITLSSYADDDEKESKMRQTMKLIKQGRHIFRHDTFGNEPFWGGQLRLHEAIAGETNGGVGPGVSPNTALALGLKVDVKALPKSLRKQLKQDKVDLDSAATTLALLQLDINRTPIVIKLDNLLFLQYFIENVKVDVQFIFATKSAILFFSLDIMTSHLERSRSPNHNVG